ncbi:MAG TPA: glycosyltransferase family 2 protein [Allosphingosinicella sp.]|nr:glycosyltransferase family 2 protein [Allosphingosinicella sp.]
MTDRILVFVPCYNCAAQIGRVLGQVRGEVARHVEEVLVLDNGSRDGTADAAIASAPAAKAPRVTVARNRENYNLGGSHKAAYAYAEAQGFSHVVTLHGDDQGDLGDILPVLADGTHRRFDACMGARFTRGSRLTNYSAFRIFGNRAFNLVFSAAAGRWVADMGSGLNLLARRAFADRAILRLPDDLHFNPYLLLDMYDRGNAVTFFPISWREEDQVSNVRMASQALKTLGAAARYGLARRAFRRRDYRAAKRESYVFDVLARFEGGERTI